MTDLFCPPLSVTEVNGMTVTVYPQLIHIKRGIFERRYSGYSKTDAINSFRKHCKEQKIKIFRKYCKEQK